MSYSVCRFWAYDESKKFLGVGTSDGKGGKRNEAWRLALAGSMAGGIAGFVGNPAGECAFIGSKAVSWRADV